MKNKFFLQKITEGITDVYVYKNKENEKGPGIKQNIPFYNPSMQLNRDLSVILCQFLVNNSKKELKLLDGLAASGIRGIRFANEIKGDFKVYINDWNDESHSLIKKNIEINNLEEITAYNRNLNALLSEEKFDYIDVDPFGSPAGFIDSAMRGIKNGGVIACSATDTAALCGVYNKVCMRRYGAAPFHSVVMKEIGLRILLGFICRAAGVYDKAITPLLCYSSDHYFRVYVKVHSSVSLANKAMSKIRIIHAGEKVGLEAVKNDIGPIWLGKLGDKKTITELLNIAFSKKLGCKNQIYKLLDVLAEEIDAPAFFYTTESIASFLKKSSPRLDLLYETLRKQGYHVYKTHFSPTGFKTDAPMKIIEKVFKQ
jgi:tRNA (guanine26-N2/guanine27-N2)-dimethyltransferase